MDKGAHFHCSDFQVHTPRDVRWVGENAVSAIERKQFAQKLIKACRERGIDAIAVTDHHDLALVDYIREAAANELDDQDGLVAEESRIIVFPGMELTLAVPCQALIIFDANLPKDLFPLILNKLAIAQAPDDQSKSTPPDRLRYRSFKELQDALDEHAFLKGRYITVPNVSEGGASTLLRAGHAIHYRDMPCVGGYLDGKIEQLGVGNRNILDGKAIEYGNKPLGLFQTSDNRRGDFRDLETSTTWIKWAEPTAEALRQACLARESRISQVKPMIPMVALTSLNVSNSAFMGPFFIEFNNQFNAVIGGRGTGKSTVLEYLRWALCDEPPTSLDEGELPNYQLRRTKLIEQTLKAHKANAEVSFTVNGVPHVVRRDAATDERTLKIGNGEFEPCSETDIKNLLPIQAYSQKQLSSVAVRLEELLRFVYTPIHKELEGIDTNLDSLALQISAVYDSLKQKRLVQLSLNNAQKELKSLTEQVVKGRSNLQGLGKEEQKTLSEYANYEREGELVAIWVSYINRIKTSFTNLTKSIDLAPSLPSDMDELLNATTLKKMGSEITELDKNITDTIKDASSILSKFESENSQFDIAKKQWELKQKQFLEAYSRAKEKSSTHEAIVKKLTDLENQLKNLREHLATDKAKLRDIGEPEEQFSRLRSEWCELHEARSNLLEEQCKILTSISGSRIRATLKRGALVSKITESLRAHLTGSKIRGEKIDALCATIPEAEKPIYKYKEILDELELLALYDSDEPSTRLPLTPTLIQAGFMTTELLKIAQKLKPESWLGLCLMRLGDEPVFEYQRKEGEYIAFEDASAGQQATSLLWALLNQPGHPLIIDQPEDDLDNRMILEIVQQIWKAKQVRQLIFSSHNANIVVNGDADLVICCDYRVAGQQSGGQIKYTGAIDMKDIRDEITKVTEGGAEAFRLRKAKYGF